MKAWILSKKVHSRESKYNYKSKNNISIVQLVFALQVAAKLFLSGYQILQDLLPSYNHDGFLNIF